MLILHGENIVLSRKRLTEKIGEFKTRLKGSTLQKGEIIRLEGKTTNLTELKQAVESGSLFGQERLVVIENIFSCRPSKEKEEILGYLKKNNPENLIIWEGKTIDGRVLTPFSGVKVEKFALTPIIFKFLDSLAPGNQKNSLFLLHQCLNQELPEMVFYMLARQVRLLIIAADLGEKGLSNLSEWQRVKFLRQAKKFNLGQLLHLYRQLLKIDWQQKTGETPLSLASQLDLLIACL